LTNNQFIAKHKKPALNLVNHQELKMKKKLFGLATVVFSAISIAAPANAYVDIICDPVSMTCVTVDCSPVEVDLPDGTTQTLEVCEVVGNPDFPA